jgi:antirestriction protein ArdC
MTQDRADVYTRITAEIIAAIEAGAGEFKMPWHHTGTSTARPTNIASGKNYRGVNVLALWAAAEIARYDSGLWGTYRQWVRRAKSHERSSQNDLEQCLVSIATSLVRQQ